MVTYSGDEYVCFPGITQEIDGVILISLLEVNGLIKIDAATGLAKFLCHFQHESVEFQLHVQIVAYQDKVVFVPWNAENIAVYHLKSDRWKYVPAHMNRDPGRFIAGRQNGKYLYLVLEDALKIVKFDMDSEEIVNDYILKGDRDLESLSYVRPIKISQEIWKIAQNGKLSWKFSLENNRYSELKYLFNKKMKFVAGCNSEDYIWIVTDCDEIYQITSSGEQICQYNIHEIMSYIYKDQKREILESIFLNETLFIISYEKNSIVKIPFVDNNLEVAQARYLQFENAFFSVEEDKLIITTDNEIIILNNFEEKRVAPHVQDDFFKVMITKRHLVVREINSCFLGDMRDFLFYILTKKNSISITDFPQITIGERIFDKIIKGG